MWEGEENAFIHLVYWMGKGKAEESGNPVIPAGALQLGCQEILQGTAT